MDDFPVGTRVWVSLVGGLYEAGVYKGQVTYVGTDGDTRAVRWRDPAMPEWKEDVIRVRNRNSIQIHASEREAWYEYAIISAAYQAGLLMCDDCMRWYRALCAALPRAAQAKGR